MNSEVEIKLVLVERRKRLMCREGIFTSIKTKNYDFKIN